MSSSYKNNQNGHAVRVYTDPPSYKAVAGDAMTDSKSQKEQEMNSVTHLTDEKDDDGTVGGGVEKRETWVRSIDFLLALIGFSVGLGNVWRFPFLCYKNGGGAFLIPYFIFVVIGGIPMLFLEISLGQFMSAGGMGAWKIIPLFQGIGIATTIIVFLLNCYYNVILAWAFHYLFASFANIPSSTLIWASCDNEWNTDRCKPPEELAALDRGGNLTTTPSSAAGTTDTAKSFVDPVTEYWENKVLRISDGVDMPGNINWELALCLLLAWIVVYFCIWKGIKTSGKVMYVTATSPYLLMTVLMIRGVTLDGAMEGIEFYLKPDLERLKDPQVWIDAGTQIFFSYSISLGALTALGSYNKYHHNSYRDSLLFALVNSGTSFFSGFVIFSTLGFMAKQHGTTVDKVAAAGPGLAFIAYPKALGEMPIAPFWSVLFFLMVILLGLDSQFCGVEGFVTAAIDQFPKTLRRGYNREIFIAVTSAISYLIGLSMVTEGGMYVFQLFDYYSGSRIILLVAFFMCVAIAWVYGANRYWKDLSIMLGFTPFPYMKYGWMVFTPLFNLGIFCLSAYTYSELSYERGHLGITYEYPNWAVAVGWSMAALSAVWIPFIAIYKLATAPGDTFAEKWAVVTTPVLPRRDPTTGELLEDFSEDNPVVNTKGDAESPM